MSQEFAGRLQSEFSSNPYPTQDHQIKLFQELNIARYSKLINKICCKIDELDLSLEMAEISTINPTYLFTSKIALHEMLLEKEQQAVYFMEVSMALKEIKQSNEAHKEQLESLQARLERNNHQLVAMKQQLIKVEEENSTLKKEKYKVKVECRQCRQIN